jgi:hypothetical protein
VTTGRIVRQRNQAYPRQLCLDPPCSEAELSMLKDCLQHLSKNQEIIVIHPYLVIPMSGEETDSRMRKVTRWNQIAVVDVRKPEARVAVDLDVLSGIPIDLLPLHAIPSPSAHQVQTTKVIDDIQ